MNERINQSINQCFTPQRHTRARSFKDDVIEGHNASKINISLITTLYTKATIVLQATAVLTSYRSMIYTVYVNH